MNFKNIKYFIATAEIKNFSQVAKQNNVTPAAVSLQISSMEQELGFELFHRDRNSMELTPAGEYFYEKCKTIVDLYDRSIENAKQLSDEEDSVLRVGFMGTDAIGYLAGIADKFYEQNPGASLHIEADDAIGLKEKLIFDMLDVIFNFNETLVKNEPDILTEYLGNYRYVLLISKQHRFAGRDWIDKTEIKDEKVLVIKRQAAFENADNLNFVHILEYYKDSLYEVDSVELIKMYVELNQGVAFIPETIFEYKQETCTTVKIKGIDDKVQLMLCSKKNSEKNQLIKSFTEITKDYFHNID